MDIGQILMTDEPSKQKAAMKLGTSRQTVDRADDLAEHYDL